MTQIPSMADLARYRPRWGGEKELNLGDEWRAQWEEAGELPEHAPTFYHYTVVVLKDRGYVTRPVGEQVWRTVEGPLEPGQVLEDAIREEVYRQTGVVAQKLRLIGYFECKATRHNTAFPMGSVTVRPVYVAIGERVDDIPDNSGFERRRLPLNEFVAALRRRHIEIQDQLGKAVDTYLVMRARGEA
ncbi:MAG: hypothetical protein Kow0010_25920 [Dehalococcoidia bacterium]